MTEMQSPKVQYTYHDYVLLSDDVRRELIEGDYLVVPAPNIKYQRIIMKLSTTLDDHVEASSLGVVLPAPTDVVLSKENVVQPDILFISSD